MDALKGNYKGMVHRGDSLILYGESCLFPDANKTSIVVSVPAGSKW